MPEGFQVTGKDGLSLSLGMKVQVSECESGEVIGIAVYDTSQPQVLVDYICGDGGRTEAWWHASRVTLLQVESAE